MRTARSEGKQPPVVRIAADHETLAVRCAEQVSPLPETRGERGAAVAWCVRLLERLDV